jgi:hypothetical protein
LVSQGVWGCVIEDVIISPTCNVYCNACCSKSKVQKSSFLHGFTATNGEFVLLTIESKWFKAIVHTTKATFLKLSCPRQVQLLISIHICGKF